jgi:large subunit ribosomal protein L35
VLPPVILFNRSCPRGQNIYAKNENQELREKRFRVRPGGTVKSGMAFKRHILTKKTTKNKRQLRGTRNIDATDVQRVYAMMPSA